MKKAFFTLALTGVILAAAAPSMAQPAAQPSARQCLRSNQIDSFSAIKGDERSMVVIDRFRNKYKLGFNTVCNEIDFAGAVAIRSRSNTGLSCIERGDVVTTRSVSGWQDRCVINSIQPYTAAMEKADRDQAARAR